MPLNHMTRLLEKYRKTVIPAMQKAFSIDNVMAVPKIEKVVINSGVGRIAKDDISLDSIAG
ncbi:MAG: hypothetical protein AAB875_04385 [Patescibacteria group bacterium]